MFYECFTKLLFFFLFQGHRHTIRFDLSHIRRQMYFWSATRSPTPSHCTTSRTNGSQRSGDIGPRLRLFFVAANLTSDQMQRPPRPWRGRAELLSAENKVWQFVVKSGPSILSRPARPQTPRTFTKPSRYAPLPPSANRLPFPVYRAPSRTWSKTRKSVSEARALIPGPETYATIFSLRVEIRWAAKVRCLQRR